MSGDATQPTTIRGSPTKYVKLNVGGSLHYTTIGTLSKQDSMLRAMFSGRMEVLTDTDGWILIDRCGKHFPLVLNFLRDGSVPLPQSEVELQELLMEAKYYLIEQLVELCEKALEKKKEEHDPICRVPLITSAKEERQLVTGKKPVVKLSYNRSNNKYSYTGCQCGNCSQELLENISECYCCQELDGCIEAMASDLVLEALPEGQKISCITDHPGFKTVVLDKWSLRMAVSRFNTKEKKTYKQTGSEESQSDDNLLKNIELFDKLSLRFNGRILFIKDLIGNNEICCWTFYGNGKKLAEVCCTSIVYATEKPQTKVEFPDSRIYEEALNVLLYEHRGTGNFPDAELLSATRRAVGPRVIPESDEESSRKQDKNR